MPYVNGKQGSLYIPHFPFFFPQPLLLKAALLSKVLSDVSSSLCLTHPILLLIFTLISIRKPKNFPPEGRTELRGMKEVDIPESEGSGSL